MKTAREWEPWERNFARWLAMGSRGRRHYNRERQEAGKRLIPTSQAQYAQTIGRHRNSLTLLKSDPEFRELVHYYQRLPVFERWGSIVRAMCDEAERGNVAAAKFVGEYGGYFVPSMKAQVEGKVEHKHTNDTAAELQKFMPMIVDAVRMIRESSPGIELTDFELVASLVSHVVPDVAPQLGPRLQPAHGTANSSGVVRSDLPS